DGVDRWDLRDRTNVHLGRAEGLPTDGALALAAEPGGQAAWIATQNGLARYDATTGAVTPVPSPARAARGIGALLADPDGGGGWVGSAAGLYHVDASGTWQPVGRMSQVTALLRASTGELWIGFPGGVARQDAAGAFRTYGKGDGVTLRVVRAILEGPGGA